MIDLQSYIGRQEVRHDRSDGDRFARLAATLNHNMPPWRPSVLPPLGHWLCFLPAAQQSIIGVDGHPERSRDGLLPPIDLPRRMWAGSRIRFLDDIPLDVAITRTSTLIAVRPKSGRSGNIILATLRHEIGPAGGAVAIVEEHDIVYREAPPHGASFARTAADPGDPDPVVLKVTPDPVLLFRYSALTFNAHRIHYDRDYARNEEGYPGLVVQGPLVATLMLNHLLREHSMDIRAFSFRALSPLFDGEVIRLSLRRNGNKAEMRALGPAGIAMAGVVDFAS